MIHYVCKYTPLELFKGFGEECAVLEEMPENFELSDQIAHANLCGFGKSVIQAVLEGKVEQLVLLTAVIPCAVCTTLWKVPVNVNFCTCWTCLMRITTVKR